MRITSPVLAAGILVLASSPRALAHEPWSFQIDPSKNAALAEQLEKTAQQRQDLSQAAAQRQVQRPTVNCGLTLVPPDPKLDAAIRVPAPTRVTPTIRTVTPPMCRAEATRQFTVPTSPRR